MIVALCLVVLAAVTASQYVFAEPTQASTTVDSTYLKVQLSYPSEVLPGQSLTVSVQVTSKDNFRLVSLTIQIYYADGNNLRLLKTAAVANNTYMNTGNRLNAEIQATVPGDAPRTSLVAMVSENVRIPNYDYYYPLYYYYDYYSYPFMSVYQSYYYFTITDNQLAPLSYIKATIPEYVSLQRE